MAAHRPIRDESGDQLLRSGALEGRAQIISGPPVTYSRNLLDKAKKFAEQGEFGVAVITAHTACEVAVEQVISQQLQARKIEENVEDAIESLLNGYSLNNKGLQLYVALTGDAINQQKPLWDNYLRSVGRRNKVVHRGSSVDRAGAEESLQVATDFISHLKQL